MTNTQKKTLARLNHEYKTVGLDKVGMRRKYALENQAKDENERLAWRLKHWSRRTDTNVGGIPQENPVNTVYVNSVV